VVDFIDKNTQDWGTQIPKILRNAPRNEPKYEKTIACPRDFQIREGLARTAEPVQGGETLLQRRPCVSHRLVETSPGLDDMVTTDTHRSERFLRSLHGLNTVALNALEYSLTN